MATKEKTLTELLATVENAELGKAIQNAYNAELKAKDDAHATALKEKDDAHATALKAKDDAHATALKAKDDAHATALKEKDDAAADTLAELADLKSKYQKTIRQVEGSFESQNGKKYTFVKGTLEFQAKHPEESEFRNHKAEDALKDPVLMEHLIAKGAGCLVEVK